MRPEVRLRTRDGSAVLIADPTVAKIRKRVPHEASIGWLSYSDGEGYTLTLEWDEDVEVTDDILASCLRGRPEWMTEGRKTARMLGRRVLLVKDVGPPKWRWPRVQIGRWRIRVGWRFTAYAIGWR